MVKSISDLRIKDGQFNGEKSAPVLDLKILNEAGEFEGYASTFGNVDQGGDVVMPGAFAESLRKRPVERIKMLYQHNRDEIIGKWIEAREDSTGLFVKGRLFQGVQRGREAYELMKEEALDGMSIGFKTIRDEWDRETDTRKLLEIELREVSLVTFPMNELATVQLVKAGGELPTEREMERWLVRDAGFSAREAKVICAKGFKHLIAERDAGGVSDSHSERDAGNGDDGLLEALRAMRESLAKKP